MKKINILYWIFTGLLAAIMLMSGIQNALSTAPSVELVSKHLGYPLYFIPFIGVAKCLGAIVILIPGFPRLKEWVYAGFVYDLTGALYSSISVGDPASQWWLILIFPAILACSYIFYQKRRKATASLNVK